jgi:hypothetical protein
VKAAVMTTSVALTSEEHFKEAIGLFSSFKDRHGNSPELCFPRPSFIPEREDSKDLRILFVGQAYANNCADVEQSFETAVDKAAKEAKRLLEEKNGSSFWSIGVKPIIKAVLETERDELITPFVGWSNVLKISLFGENPQGAILTDLVKHQAEMAKRHLRHELFEAGKGRFDAVVFLTNMFMWNDYLSEVLPEFDDSSRVVKTGYDEAIHRVDYEGIGPVIFGRHPQGSKREIRDELVAVLESCVDGKKLKWARERCKEQAEAL